MKKSAGILPYRKNGGIWVYLAHFGGPYWKNKKRSWTIVKGELQEEENPLEGAKREFYEETGKEIEGELLDLGEIKSGNKINHIFAVEAPDLTTDIVSNSFTIEWPPNSGKMVEFPEIDEARWFKIDEAKEVIVKSLLPFLERLKQVLKKRG